MFPANTIILRGVTFEYLGMICLAHSDNHRVKVNNSLFYSLLNTDT